MRNTFSVQDLLNTHYLKDITKVVAGREGLSKSVSWVHILEIRDIIKDCVNGGELVLTTGIGFSTKATALNFLQELINQNVSALCIETQLYYHEIDNMLIKLANDANFPLIEITAISRFVDITKGLNTIILNRSNHRTSQLVINYDHFAKNDWIEKWIKGDLNEHEIYTNLKKSSCYDKLHQFIFGKIMFTSSDINNMESHLNEIDVDKQEFLLQIIEQIKSIFNDNGIFFIGYLKHNDLNCIVMNPSNKNMCEKISKCVKQLRTYRNKILSFNNALFCFGKTVNNCLQVYESYDTTKDLLAWAGGQYGNIIFYDYLYINRIMNKIKSYPYFKEFISDHLGELISEENIDLLNTMKIYFECNCSKQQTAEKLFVARQTLYYRLDKIRELLGTGFDEGHRRLAIEFAINAYFFLQETDSVEFS